MDRNVHPPIVSKLHYQFDGWLGDYLLECFPCFICTEKLMEYLKSSDLTGFADCEISKSEQFTDLYPDRILPVFYWLVVNGDANNDFSLSPNASLLVSENALNSLKKFQTTNCEIENYFN
ncbi:hypothetical protein [Mucilaginibacter celer]|uniref:hypothetical protein n=1 Tax=Mucilaginibacter celer TaxID=2305508 RepID=UPI0019694E7F|nr:hypothetical protein [Mucilaginibacter celer]